MWDFHRKQCSSSQKNPSWAETQETTSVMRPIRNRSTLRLESHGADCFIQTKCCWQRKSALITGLICPFCGVCDVKRGPQSKHKNVTFPQRAAAYKSGEEGKAPPGTSPWLQGVSFSWGCGCGTAQTPLNSGCRSSLTRWHLFDPHCLSGSGEQRFKWHLDGVVAAP